MSKSMFFLVIAAINLLWFFSCQTPFFGHFGYYQASTGMMAELMGKDGWITFFQPRTFAVTDGTSTLHLLYYPFSALFARLAQLGLGWSIYTIPFLGKLQAMIWMNLAAFVFGRIVGILFVNQPNLRRFGVVLFYLTPMIVIEGSAFRNEAFTLFVALFALERTLAAQSSSTALAGFFYGLSVVSRVHFSALILPHLFLIFLKEDNRSKRLLLWIGFAAIPIALWLGYFKWLDNSSAAVSTSIFSQAEEGRFLILKLIFSFSFLVHMLKQFFFYLCNPVVAVAAIVGLGFVVWWRKIQIRFNAWWVIVWLFSAMTVIVLLPKKVVDHPFYLISAIPPFLIVILFLLNSLAESKILKARWNYLFVLIGLMVAVGVSWNPLMKAPKNSSLWLERAQRIETMTQPSDIIVVQHPQASSMLYYMHRLGWEYDLNMMTSGVLKSPQLRHRRMVERGYGDPVMWLRELVRHGAQYLFISDFDLFFKSSVAYNFRQLGIEPFYQDEDWLGFSLEKLKTEAGI